MPDERSMLARSTGSSASTREVHDLREQSGKMYSVVGGAHYDPTTLSEWIQGLPPEAHLIVGNGRGVEGKVRELALERGLRVDTPPLRPEYYDSPLDTQIFEVLALGNGPIVVIGTGGRPNKARAWYKRAKWGRELVEV